MTATGCSAMIVLSEAVPVNLDVAYTGPGVGNRRLPDHPSARSRPSARTAAAYCPGKPRCSSPSRSSGHHLRYPKTPNPLQDSLEELLGHSHFCHLKDHVAGVGDNLGPDLDQLLPQGGQ